MLKRIAAAKAQKAQWQTSRGKTRAAQQALPRNYKHLQMQDAGTYPDRLEEVLGAMSAELGVIAQAVREGKISRDQAAYLSLEPYYVALARFQLLRMLYQPPQESNPPQSFAQANTSPGRR